MAPDELLAPDETDTPRVRLGSGSALSLATQVIGLGASFLVGVVAARTLGVAGKGTLSVIMQTPGILVIILDLGIATSTIYFVSRRELRPGSAAANSILIAGAIGVLAVPLVYVLLASRFAVVSGVPMLAVVVAILIVPTSLLAAWTNAVSVGVGNLVLPLRCAITSAGTMLVVLAALVVSGHASVGTIAAASLAGTVAGLVVFAFGLRRVVTPLRPDWAAARAASSFSARVHLSNVAGFLLERQDVLLLGWLSGAAAVGLYSVGVSFAELTWYIPSALCTAIMARGGRGSESSGVDYVTRATRIALIIMIGTVGVSLIAVPLVIPLIYGRAFAPAMYSFFALLPGVMADGIARVLWAYQTTRGRLYWRQALAGTAVNAALVILLAPRLGPVGAALASTVAYTGLAAYMIRRFHVDTGARYADILMPQRVDVEVMFRTAKRMLTRAG
jgi:O-antigen/teichoic acid export membrane protein